MLKDVESEFVTEPSQNPVESAVSKSEVDNNPKDRPLPDSGNGDAQSGERCDLESLRQATIVICLVVLAILGIGYTMYFAKAIFMPIVFAFLLNFIFSPTVIALRKMGIPNAAGAILLMIGGLALVAGLFWMLFAPAKNWLDRAPEHIASIEQKVKAIAEPLQAIKLFACLLETKKENLKDETFYPSNARFPCCFRRWRACSGAVNCKTPD